MEQIPNHICKYSGCKLGNNNKPKEYYACPDCGKHEHWKSMGCTFEHYLAYQNEVAISRGKEIPFPEVIEMMLKDGVLKNNLPIDESANKDNEIKSKKPKLKK